MAGIAGRVDAPTQLAAGSLTLQARFPDGARRFNRLGRLDFFSLLDGFWRFNFLGNGFLWFDAKTSAEPACDFLDDLGEALDGRETGEPHGAVRARGPRRRHCVLFFGRL